MDNKVKIPCGGFYLGDGLTMDGNTLKSSGVGKQVQSDWNQNDSSAVDYVKNRPFWESDPVITFLIEERTESFTYGEPVILSIDESIIDEFYTSEPGAIFSIVWDNVLFECVLSWINQSTVTIGNSSLINYGDDTGEPFVILIEAGRPYMFSEEGGEHTFSVFRASSVVHKLDEKYLPETVMKSEYAAYVMPCINADLVKDITYFSDVISDETYTADCTASEWRLLANILKIMNSQLIVYASSRLVVQVDSTNENNLTIYGSRYIAGVQKINKTNLQFDETSETLTVTQYAQTT